MSVIQAEGLEAVFECLHPGAISYGWAINGAFLLDFPPGVRIGTSINPASLIISVSPEYNNVVIQCVASVPGLMGGFLPSVNATLTVYGLSISLYMYWYVHYRCVVMVCMSSNCLSTLRLSSGKIISQAFFFLMF